MQIDTGNSSDGGGDPIACLRNYPGQAVTVHLKEYSAKNKNAILGEGDLDWKTIFSICETTGGTEWYIIEEEKDIYPADEGRRDVPEELQGAPHEVLIPG